MFLFLQRFISSLLPRAYESPISLDHPPFSALCIPFFPWSIPSSQIFTLPLPAFMSPHPMISCLPQLSSLLPISPSPLPLSSPHLRPLTHQDQALPVHQLWPPSALWCLMMMLLVGYAINDCVRATGTACSAPCKSFHSMWWGQSLHIFFTM